MAAASSAIRVAARAPGFRDFMNIEAAKAELAADVVEPLAVAFGELPFGALLQPADGDDDWRMRAD